MEKVSVYYHKESDTMDIWFGDPAMEASCEEAGEGLILKKSGDGRIIGIEKLFVSKAVGIASPFPVELVVD